MVRQYVAKGPPRLPPRALEIAETLLQTQSQNLVAAQLGVDSSGLGRALKKFRQNKRRKLPLKETRGRPKAFSPAQVKKFMKQFRLDKRTGKRPTAKVTLRKTRLIRVATPRTAQRELNANKQKWRRRLCKSCLKPGDAEERDEFAEENEDTDWHTTLDALTDCKTFSMPLEEQPPNAGSYLWCEVQEALLPWATKSNDIRFKGPGVHIYGGFGPDRSKGTSVSLCDDPKCPCHGSKSFRKGSWKGYFFEEFAGGKGGWSAPICCSILEKKFLPKVRALRPRKQLAIQVDGDGVFTSKFIKRWSLQRNCKLFPIPPRSGDWAPIEKAWGYITLIIEKEANAHRLWRKGAKDTPANFQKWRKFVKKCIRKVPAWYWTNLGNGIHKRTQMLKAARGQRIRG